MKFVMNNTTLTAFRCTLSVLKLRTLNTIPKFQKHSFILCSFQTNKEVLSRNYPHAVASQHQRTNHSYFTEISRRGFAEFKTTDTELVGKQTKQLKKKKNKKDKKDVDENDDTSTPVKGNPTHEKKPLNLDYSGDLQRTLQYDPNATFFPYQDIEELKNAPPTVQKLCTVAFADRAQRKFQLIHDAKKKIEEVHGIKYNREMIIANMTLQIRAMLPHVDEFRKDIKAKVFLIEKIAKRKKEMKKLRREDYVSFLWLLKMLKIKYIPPKPYSRFESKFARQKRLAREAAVAQQQQQLEELKVKLAEEKKVFLVEKEKIIADIEVQIAEYDLDKRAILKAVEQKRKEKMSTHNL